MTARRLFQGILTALILAAAPNAAFADSDNPARIILVDPEDVPDNDAGGDKSTVPDDNQNMTIPTLQTPPTPSNGAVKGHGFQLAMTFAGIPSGILDAWFSKHGDAWDGVANMGVSLDYFLRFTAPCEMRFSLSWISARTGNAYWLDKDHADNPILADYIVNHIGLVNLEIAAYHIIPIIDEIAFYYGGGIWGGAVVGDAKSYAIRAKCAENTNGNINACPHEPGSTPVTGIPPVFGFVMATVGFKFTLLDIMTIRAEGGFKGYFYGQLAVGAQF